MKHLLVACICCIFIISCTKSDLNDSSVLSENLKSKVSPDVLQCGTGYHWDYYLKKCVVDCQEGYHNDSITGACVIDGSGEDVNITAVSNPNNPDEIVGQNHNLGMELIMPNYNDGQLQPTEQNVLAFTKSFLSSQGYDTVTFNESYNYEKQHFDLDIRHQGNITSITNILYSQGLISSTGKNYLLDLSNTVASFSADSISIPSQATYNTFANNLITYENQFGGNVNLSANDKYVLFSAYSVARYSVVYAIDYSISLSSPCSSTTFRSTADEINVKLV